MSGYLVFNCIINSFKTWHPSGNLCLIKISLRLENLFSPRSQSLISAPEFIYSFEDSEYVYFLFKEIAAEKYPERIYSRVARICKSDEGSQNPFFKDNFLTFIKAKIYCQYSRDGSSPYTFESICECNQLMLLLILEFK